MDAVEEAMDHSDHSSSSNNAKSNDQSPTAAAVVKGKRTKRQRAATAVAAAPASPTSSAELSSSTTEEEEDMANCLILLAQGRALDAAPQTETTTAEEAVPAEKFTSRKPTDAATTAANGKAAGVYVYQCKTCNKCFPSFQALGGHRTSHKKPKMALLNEDKKPVADEDGLQMSINSLISKPVVTSNNSNIITGIGTGSNKPRVHECSICGSEFSSGQALGGHMRRHRPITAAEPSEVKKEKNVVLPTLDLNLPAPSDDEDCEEGLPPPASSAPAAAFPFDSQQPLVFSASALVDCHY